MLVTRNRITEKKKNISFIYWAPLHETPSTANRYTKWTSNQCSNRLKTDHKQIYVHLIYVFADQISCRSIRFTLAVHKSTLVPEIFQLKVSSSSRGIGAIRQSNLILRALCQGKAPWRRGCRQSAKKIKKNNDKNLNVALFTIPQGGHTNCLTFGMFEINLVETYGNVDVHIIVNECDEFLYIRSK